jgi:hypothetical protein
MIKKIKQLIKENREFNRQRISHLKEIEWAHIYHDSIRGIEWIQGLSLNIGRWAGNYSFFYVLNRILMDYKPKNILELGLGESSKFISTYLDNYLLDSNHLIIEQNELWSDKFQNEFKLSNRSKIVCCPLESKKINGFEVNSYSNFIDKIPEKYDLYVIDGPLGSEHFSRYEIIGLAESFNKNDEFVIIFDDFNRVGEKETFKELKSILKRNNVKYYTYEYTGNKSVKVLVTKKYKYAISL